MTVSFHLDGHLPTSPQRMLKAKLKTASLFDRELTSAEVKSFSTQDIIFL